MAIHILGISAFYHDSAAALISDGKIVAAAQEERFSRIKHDAGFPHKSIEFVLKEAGIKAEDLEIISFYDKPFLKFERILESFHSFIPKGYKSFLKSMPVWIKEKLFIKKIIREEIKKLGDFNGDIQFPEHHLSHAASAFFPSPFEEAAILTVDGVGEWSTASICKGSGSKISIFKEMHYPHSLGLLYSSFTYFLGFKVNNGEYKMMGLAPYGDRKSKEFEHFRGLITDNIVSIKPDGSVQLNMQYFQFATGLKMIYSSRWEKLFGIERRESNDHLMEAHMNLALAIQDVTESIILSMARTAGDLSKSKNLVMAGGVALNSVANGKISKAGIFENIWIQPAAGDAGASIGAALASWYISHKQKRTDFKDEMKGAFLGPAFSNNEVEHILSKSGLEYKLFDSNESCLQECAKNLSKGSIIGFFQGKMEFGPRALGHRSILADPRNQQMQNRLNASIKFREEFRPFAPAILKEHVEEYFDQNVDSPYMLFVYPLKEEQRIVPGGNSFTWKEKLNQKRSEIPSVTHIDYSARIQTVGKEENPVFWELLHQFYRITGCPVLINTSFNLKGEAIVCTPDDAVRCFKSTNLDYLVIENFIAINPNKNHSLP